MRIIVHGTLEQVAAVSPGPLVVQVTSVSQLYRNRKGTPRLYRVYLDAEITPPAPPARAPATPPAASPAPAGWAVGEVAPGLPLEIPEAGDDR